MNAPFETLRSATFSMGASRRPSSASSMTIGMLSATTMTLAASDFPLSSLTVRLTVYVPSQSAVKLGVGPSAPSSAAWLSLGFASKAHFIVMGSPLRSALFAPSSLTTPPRLMRWGPVATAVGATLSIFEPWMKSTIDW